MSSRPCSVVTVLRASASKSGKCSRSVWKCRTSNCRSRSFDLVQHGQVRGEVGFQRRGSSRIACSRTAHQPRLGACIGRGEQRDLVAEIAQRIAQVRDDSLRAAIELRRYGFVERGDLGNFHILRDECSMDVP